MGNSETHVKKEKSKSVPVSHPAFETAELVRTNFNKEMMQTKVSVKSEKDYQEWIKAMKRIPKTNSMFFPEETAYINKSICGSSGIAQIHYQLFPYVLSEEIEIRRENNNSHFDEKEIWLLVFSLVEAAEIFHVRKLKLGDIRPENVVMNSQGEIKIMTQYTYPYATTNYTFTVTSHEYTTYLGTEICYIKAPEEIKDIQFGKIKDTNDPLIVESFSIGLTLLDAALLTSSVKVYENTGLFGYEQLNENIRLLSTLNYSPQLKAVITNMCHPQPASRLKANEVMKYLKPFTSEILSKKPFNIKSLPWGQEIKTIINNPIVNPSNKIINNSEKKIILINQNDLIIKPNEQKEIKSKPEEYKFIPGVVFDSRDDGLMKSSSLKQAKEVVIETSKGVNTYEIPQKDELPDLQCPVQTSVYYPPITIQLPPPIQHNNNPHIGH